MTTYYVSGKNNDGHYLACIWYNLGGDGTFRGKDETEMAEKVAGKLENIGWKFSFGEDNSLCFEVVDHDDYLCFVKDFQRIKKELKQKER